MGMELRWARYCACAFHCWRVGVVSGVVDVGIVVFVEGAWVRVGGVDSPEVGDKENK